MGMTLGFTGTQQGMAPRQRKTVRRLLYQADVLHLGDCVGADAEAHNEALHLGVKTVGHPPTNNRKRAFLEYDELDGPKPYLKRNWSIVYAGVDGLIAAPKDFTEPPNLRGQGTWTTINYARKIGRRIWIVRPDGTVKEENPTSKLCSRCMVELTETDLAVGRCTQCGHATTSTTQRRTT